ncbi:MAG: hypothetical protein AAFN09_01020 [Pseudomonadota bacterium]
MTLEKLLIFGLGIAVVAALTLSASGIREERQAATDGYRGKVEDLVERAN